MDIMQSPLGLEINAIFNNGNSYSAYYYKAEIRANNTLIPALKVISVDIVQDFEQAVSDVVVIKLVVGAGTYTYRIFPYLSNLEIILFQTPLRETEGSVDSSISTNPKTYRATLMNPIAPAVENNFKLQPSEKALDLSNLLELEFQLQDFTLEQLRMLSTGGIYRNCLVQDVICSVLTKESVAVDVDGTQVPVGVDMVPSVNTKKRDHIIIPHGTRMIDVPAYIHEHCGGVYGSGFSNYFLNSIWYVYPCYDTTRFDRDQRTLTIIRVPNTRMPSVQRTYQLSGSSLKILATGDGKTFNHSESNIYNQGNGVRFADAEKFVGEFVQVSDNVALTSRGANNNEFTSIQRETGYNNVVMSPTRITANPLLEYSKLALRDGSHLVLTWENSNPELLYPGMQVKVLYLENEVISEIYGILLKAHHFIAMVGQGMIASRHVTNSSLLLFVKRQTKLSIT